jgi:hypothetical protein
MAEGGEPYHLVCNKSNTMGATCGARTAYPSGTPKFIPPPPSIITGHLHLTEIKIEKNLIKNQLTDMERSYLNLVNSPF